MKNLFIQRVAVVIGFYLITTLGWTQTNYPQKTVQAKSMETQLETVVRRYNKEVIEEDKPESAKELIGQDFVNHSAADGMDPGVGGMLHFFNNILRPAFPDLKVTIQEQIAEGDLVTTRKLITGTHQGTLLSIAPTGKAVSIQVIDIIRVRNGQLVEHWGLNTFSQIMTQLSGK